MFHEVIKPRIGETDALGHINNTVIPQWFEGARNPVFKLLNPDSNLNLNQWNFTLAKTTIDFHMPLKFGIDIEIKTYINRVGNSSLDIYQEVWQQNKKYVSGTAIMVHFDYKKRKSIPIPDSLKQKIHMHFSRPA